MSPDVVGECCRSSVGVVGKFLSSLVGAGNRRRVLEVVEACWRSSKGAGGRRRVLEVVEGCWRS